MTARQPPSPSSAVDHEALLATVSRQWDADIVPQLIEYVRIPAKSPGFDRDSAKLGRMDESFAAYRQAAARIARNTSFC